MEIYSGLNSYLYIYSETIWQKILSVMKSKFCDSIAKNISLVLKNEEQLLSKFITNTLFSGQSSHNGPPHFIIDTETFLPTPAHPSTCTGL